MALTGPWFVLLAAMLWGTTGTAQAFAPAGATPLAVGALRLACGGTILLLVARGRGQLGDLRAWPRWTTLGAAASVAAYQVFFFAGVARTGVALGTVVCIGSAPVITGFLELLIRRERPTRRWLAATALAVVGCGLLLTAGKQVQVDISGVLLSLTAGLCYAVFVLTSKELLAVRPPDAVTAAAFFLGALFLAPVLFAVDLSWAADARGLGVVLHLGIVATALAYFLFARGLAQVPSSSATTLSLAEPLTAALLGIFLLDEVLSPAAVLGMALLLAGLAALALGGRPLDKAQEGSSI